MRMSAELFIVYYGLRWEVLAIEEDQLAQLEMRKDLRQVADRQHVLDFFVGPHNRRGALFSIPWKAVGAFRLGR